MEEEGVTVAKIKHHIFDVGTLVSRYIISHSARMAQGTASPPLTPGESNGPLALNNVRVLLMVAEPSRSLIKDA